MELKQDDVVMCTVVKIEGASVFLKIDDFPEYEASMMMSEVAAGRIRNLREYVSVGRKVVCKVLRLGGKHAEMSLRRVTGKEREIVLDRYKQEKVLLNILKTCVDKPADVLEEIKKEHDVLDFVDEIRDDASVVEKYVGKEKAGKLAEILAEKEAKDKRVVREFTLRSDSSTGVDDIKEILGISEGDVHYLGSGRFSISLSGKDMKAASAKLQGLLEEIGKKAQKKHAVMQVAKEK